MPEMPGAVSGDSFAVYMDKIGKRRYGGIVIDMSNMSPKKLARAQAAIGRNAEAMMRMVFEWLKREIDQDGGAK